MIRWVKLRPNSLSNELWGPFLAKIAVISYHCFFNLSIECIVLKCKNYWSKKLKCKINLFLCFIIQSYRKGVIIFLICAWAMSLNRLVQALEKLLEKFSVLHLNFFQESLVGNIYFIVAFHKIMVEFHNAIYTTIY